MIGFGASWWLLLLIPLALLFLPKVRSRWYNNPALKFSTALKFSQITPSRRARLRSYLWILRAAAFALLVFAVARPQTGKKSALVRSEGIDIMLCLDVSGSMRAEDFQPVNRLDAAKKVIVSFISRREEDRIGLVVYGSEAFLQCPLTLDHGVLVTFLNRLDFNPELEQRTAVGDALATAVNHLKDSKAKSRVIIMLTDGANNAGEIDPMAAAEIARTLGVKVYTVGIGVPGIQTVMTSQETPMGIVRRPAQVEMNEETLKAIAGVTAGTYFNAQNPRGLKDVYNSIDRLEKSEIVQRRYLEYEELFAAFVIAALSLLLLEFVLSRTFLRTLP